MPARADTALVRHFRSSRSPRDAREKRGLSRFVPVAGADFAEWPKRTGSRILQGDLAGGPAAASSSRQPDWWQTAKTRDDVEEPLLRAAAWYFLRARGRNGVPADPVARFHLGNGARLERLNWLADVSTRNRAILRPDGQYLRLDDIEKNHEPTRAAHGDRRQRRDPPGQRLGARRGAAAG